MPHSDNVRFLEACADKLRADLLPDAPAATITVGFPTKKKAGKEPCYGEIKFDCIRDHGEAFGSENFISIHPEVLNSPVQAMTALLVAMISSHFEPEEKTKKNFQRKADELGLFKPWSNPQPDDKLIRSLQGIWRAVTKELGYAPTAHYEPPPPKPTGKPKVPPVRLRCFCPKPRTLKLPPSFLEAGSIGCKSCGRDFRVMKDEVDGL